MKFLIGYEIPSGEPVEAEMHHLFISGITRHSGKTTSLEAFLNRLPVDSGPFLPTHEWIPPMREALDDVFRGCRAIILTKGMSLSDVNGADLARIGLAHAADKEALERLLYGGLDDDAWFEAARAFHERQLRERGTS